LQPRGFSQHGGASRNSRAWLHLIWTTVLLPPLDFQKVRATPDFKKFNLKGRVVVWLFRAECAAANAPIAEATLREIPKSDLPVQARAVSRLGGHVLFFGDCRTTGKGGG
jgi:hypothetical protein